MKERKKIGTKALFFKQKGINLNFIWNLYRILVNQYDYLIFYMRFSLEHTQRHGHTRIQHTQTERNKNLEHKSLLMSICLSFYQYFSVIIAAYRSYNTGHKKWMSFLSVGSEKFYILLCFVSCGALSVCHSICFNLSLNWKRMEILV